MRHLLRVGGVAVLALTAAVPATAGPYAANVIFGDSLSDNGNLAEALGKNFSSPPFYHDSFTNGETAVDVLDDQLGLTTNPSLWVAGGKDVYGLGLTVGTNYAVAGATASDAAGGVPKGNLTEQVGAYLFGTNGKATSSNLYTLFIGGNDVRTAAHSGNASLVASGAQAEINALNSLIAAGATNLLVVNVPDIGVIPETTTMYPSTAVMATADTDQYNSLLLAGVNAAKLANPLANITFFDFNAFSKQLQANPSAYGITDATDFCYSYPSVTTSNGSPYTVSAACQADGITHLAYWDDIHPTSTVHAAIGNALYADLVSSVPEPSSWATMMIGFGMLGAGLRRRRSVRVRFATA